MDARLLTVAALAKRWGCPGTDIRDLIDAHQLAIQDRDDGLIRIPLHEIERAEAAGIAPFTAGAPGAPVGVKAGRSAIPNDSWPRGMSRDLAAAYVGVSPNTFAGLVAAGRMPPPIDLGIRRNVWDRAAIDEVLDHLSGFAPSSSARERRAMARIDAQLRPQRRAAAQ